MKIFTPKLQIKVVFILIVFSAAGFCALFAQPNNGNTCATAVNITSLVNASAACGNLVSYGTGGLNASGTAAPPTCIDGGGNVTDKWLSLTVPASGRITFRFVATPHFNSVVQAFTGTCGALTALGTCTSREQRSYTGLTPGSTLFFQVWDKHDNLTGNGTTEICIWETLSCTASETRITLAHENEDGFPEESFVSIVPSGNNCGVTAFYTGGNTTQVGCAGGGQQIATPAGNGFGASNTTYLEEFCVATGTAMDMYYVDDFGDGGNKITLYAEDEIIGILDGVCDGNMINADAVVPAAGLPTCSCGNASCQGGANTPLVGFSTDGAQLGGCNAETIIPLTPPIELSPSAMQAPFTVCLTFTNPANNQGSSGGFLSGYCLLYSTSGVCSFSAAELEIFDANCMPLTATGVETDFGLFDLYGNPAEIIGGATYTACFTYDDLTDNGSGECTVYYIIPAITANAAVLLPISEVVFWGNKTDSGNLLEWKVSGAEELQYFELERKTEREDDFQTLATVAYSPDEEHYGFTDNWPESGFNIYRLKQTGFDNEVSYSNAIEILVKPDGLSRVFPNPFTETLNLQIQGMTTEANLTLFDQKGRKVLQFQPDVQGAEVQEIQVRHLPPGIYFYKIQNGTESSTGKIIRH